MKLITQQLTNFYKSKKGYKGAVLTACVNKDLKSIREQTNLSETYLTEEEIFLDAVFTWSETKEGWEYWNERHSFNDELKVGER